MLGFNGGLIGKTQTTSVSASLPGMWTLSEQLESKRNNSWPTMTGGPDSDFDKVQLLLRMNGSNGSTTFTDDSSFSRTITRSNATISTVQSKYGGSSGSFIPTSYIQTAADTGLQFPGDFTIEVWAFPTVAADMVIGTSPSDSNVQIFRLNENGFVGSLAVYISGTQVFSPTSAGITANTWQHLAFSRTGTNSRMFVNGIQIGSTVTNWSATFRMDLIGTLFYQGTRLGYDYRGYLDDFRITKGLGRYSANFTPPTAL